MSKFELAIDSDGEPFDLPSHITGWRVRRLQPDGRGRPELVYDATGRPVVLAADATFTELRDVAGAGRYRLDPVDAVGHVDAAVKTACTGHVHAAEATRDAATTGERTKAQPRMSYEDLLVESMRANIRLAEMVIEKIPAVLTAASGLITAADGASLTTRQPLPAPAPLPPPPPPEPAEEESDEYEDAPTEEPAEPAKPSWIESFLTQLGPHLPQIMAWITKAGPSILASFGGLPPGAIFDWRKAVPTKPAPTADTAGTPVDAAPAVDAAPPAEPSPTATAGTVDYTRVLQVYAQLSAAEREQAQRLVAHIPDEVRSAFLAELATLSIPEAVARVRRELVPHMSAQPNGHANGRTNGRTVRTHGSEEHRAERPSAPRVPATPAPTAPTSAMPRVPPPSMDARVPMPPGEQPTVPRGTTPPPPTTAPASAAPMPDPATPQGTSKGAEGARPLQAHLSAIWEGLSPAEREQAQRFLEGLTTDQQAAWLIELGRLPVPQAITWVRAILEANHASQPTTEGASPNAAAPAPPGVNDPR